MTTKEVSLPVIEETIEVHCINCGDLMYPEIVSSEYRYKGCNVKVHNVRSYRCEICDYVCYSSKMAEMIEQAVINAVNTEDIL